MLYIEAKQTVLRAMQKRSAYQPCSSVLKIFCIYYRMYALRKIRYEFQENKALRDKEKIDRCCRHGQEALQVIKRQVAIGNLYITRPLIIETNKNKATLN